VVEKKTVSVDWQTAFMFIPYVWIYAFYRIEKLGLGLVLFLFSIGISTALQMVLPFPYGLTVALIITIALTIRFIRKWSREWNTNLSSVSSEKKDTSEYVKKEDSSIELLKQRYAMGAISKEEFENIKKDLENS